MCLIRLKLYQSVAPIVFKMLSIYLVIAPSPGQNDDDVKTSVVVGSSMCCPFLHKYFLVGAVVFCPFRSPP